MNVLREMLREVVADECSKSAKGTQDHLGARMVELETGIRSEIGELRGQVGLVLDRLTVVESDISAMRAQLAGLARLDVQRRLDKLEARIAAIEEARQ
jgi:hypothetical protein